MSDDDWSPGGGEVNANDSEEYEPDDLVRGLQNLQCSIIYGLLDRTLT